MLMIIDNRTNYTRAYTEVNCLLDYLPQSYIDKLPKKLIDLIKKQSNENYNIIIDTNKSLLEQEFSKKTKDLISVLNYNYWATNEEKEQLKNIFYENENIYQKEVLEKYNPNNIFNKKETRIEKKEDIELMVQMTKYKENIFIKLINKIKKIIFKK